MIEPNTDGSISRLEAAPANGAATPFDLVEDEFAPPPAEAMIQTKVTHEVIEMELQPEPAPSVKTDEEEPEEGDEKGGWVVALLCAGIALVAVCLLLPLAEENHQLAYQREKLKADLEQIKKQVDVNGEFLKKVSGDPTLAERLAQRQMKFIRQGSGILDLPDESGREEMSPFLLVSLPPPNPMPPYRPLGGMLAGVVRNARLRLYVTGIGLLLLAAGVVLGGGNRQTYDNVAAE
jgi:hypothetical protein